MAAMQNEDGSPAMNGHGQMEEGGQGHASHQGGQGQAISVNGAVHAPPHNGNYAQYQPEHMQQPPSHMSDGRAYDGRQNTNRGPSGRPTPLAGSGYNAYGSGGGGHAPPQPAGMRVQSPTGGIQMTIDAAGSWSQLARQDATLPADANNVNEDKSSSSSGGVFGLFGRKKGRGHSPKPKERGVLGKEGARVIIG